MAEVGIKKMSVRHDAIAEYLIANPTAPLGEVAAHFNVTQPWLSCILHSDVFQAYYAKMRGEFVDSRIMPLRDKLMGIAHAAADRLEERLPTITDPRVLTDIMDKTMGRLGYGQPKAPAGITINANGGSIVTAISAAELDEARARYRLMQNALAEDPAVVETVPNGAAATG